MEIEFKFMIKTILNKVGLLKNRKTVIPRAKHNISRRDISSSALKVLNRLHKHGYQAYLVGGGVRDLLLGLHPKDFDVVTNAKPEEIRGVFRNCRLIGRRFRLAHIYFGREIVEVATFRGAADPTNGALSHSEKGMILRDNIYGTLEEDVWRRDFTVNALYYNIADFSIVDYTGGFADIAAKRLRMIGDAKTRFQEDPVRMLRAIRFASKLDFVLPKALTDCITSQKGLLLHVPPARLFEEMIKMFHSGNALTVHHYLKQFDLFGLLFPATQRALADDFYPTNALLEHVFDNTDKRIKAHQTVTPTFILAALLWYPICQEAKKITDNGMALFAARLKAIEKILNLQLTRMSFPKRLVQGAREIWVLQMRLANRHQKRVYKMLAEPRIRAAVDFLELRTKAGENVGDLARWWRAFVDEDNDARKKLIKSLTAPKRRKPKRPKKQTKAREASWKLPILALAVT